jgi:hypothetical protein
MFIKELDEVRNETTLNVTEGGFYVREADGIF